MIDLNKSQLVLEDVKVRVWDDFKPNFNTGYLAIIDCRSDYPYIIWDDKCKAKELYFCLTNTTGYKHAELIQPKYKVKEFYDLVEVLKEQGYLPKKDWPNYLSSDNCKLYFLIDMFEYCGKNSDKNKYNWHKDWLEEVEED